MALAISSDSGILIEPGERAASDMTPRLLLALTALYTQRPTHTTEEQQQYSELALRLIDNVEAATRAAVAGILQHHPDAPAAVVERLGGERSSHNGDAKVELLSSPDLHCADNEHFKANPHLRGEQHASTETLSCAPAIRRPPPPVPPPYAGRAIACGAALTSLRLRGEVGICALVTQIPGEGESPLVLSPKFELAERPPRPDPLHSPSKTGATALMASRERERTGGATCDFPPPHAGEGREGEFGAAFFAASPAERRRLLSLIARRYGDDPPVAPEDTERVFGSVDVAALHGRIGEFTREFEQLIDIPRSLCERILNDPSGEAMVVAAKAAGMPIAVLQHILLLGCAAATHSVGRVYELTELYYGLDARAARDLLAQWRTQAKSSDPVAEMEADTGDHTPDAPRLKPYASPQKGEGMVRVSLRSRFSALTERVHGQAVNARYDRESVARRGLRSR